MDTATLRLVIALGFLTIAAIMASSAAARRAPSDAERASNTYPTYLPGQGDCVLDLGYGRVIEGCD